MTKDKIIAGLKQEIKELKKDIVDLMDDFEQRELPYGVAEKLGRLMDKHNIERTHCSFKKSKKILKNI